LNKLEVNNIYILCNVCVWNDPKWKFLGFGVTMSINNVSKIIKRKDTDIYWLSVTGMWLQTCFSTFLSNCTVVDKYHFSKNEWMDWLFCLKCLKHFILLKISFHTMDSFCFYWSSKSHWIKLKFVYHSIWLFAWRMNQQPERKRRIAN